MARWVSVTCAFVAVLLYSNTVDLKFCFDDKHAIRDNQDVTNLSSWMDIVKDDFWGAPLQHKLSCKSYRPLCVATFRLNYLLHELQPMGYHLVNVLLHGAVCYLYVLLCGVIFSEVWPALIAGLLFAVHPIHTEAVAGVVGRAELLGGIFFLLTFLSYRQATQNNDRGAVWFIASMVACVLAVLSKEQGITVVPVCLTYDVFLVSKFDLLAVLLPAKKQRSSTTAKKSFLGLSQSTLLRCVVLGLFGVSVLAIRLWMAGGSPKFYTVDLGAHGLKSSFHRGLNYLYLVFINSWLLLSPSLLCADWTGGTVSLITSLSDLRNMLTFATFLTLFALGLAALWNISRTSNKSFHVKTIHRQVIMALAMTIFPFIPASNLLFKVGFVVAERVLYLPSMGFCLLITIGVWHLAKHQSKHIQTLVKMGVVYLICVSAIKTVVRNRDWYSNGTLATSGIKVVRTNGKFYSMLGKEYRDNEKYNMTEKLYRMAVATEPNDTLMKRKLGSILEAQHRFVEAESVYSDMVAILSNNGTKSLTVSRIAQSDINIYAEYGLLLRKNSKFLRSNIMYREGIRLEPHSASVLEQTLDLLTNIGRLAEAVSLIDKCLKTTTDPARLYNIKATLLTYLDKKEEAVEAWRKAISHGGERFEYLIYLGFLLYDSQDREWLSQSIAVNKKCLSLQPRNHFAAFHLAESYSALGDEANAKEMYRKVLSLAPKSKNSLIKLSKILMSQKRYTEAIPVLLSGIEQMPHLIEAIELLEKCYAAIGNPNKVGEMSRMAAARTVENKRTAKALFQKALVENDKGDLDQALKYLSRAADVDPENNEAKLFYGVLVVDNHQTSQYSRAKQMLEEVLSSDSRNITAMLKLAMIHYTLNNITEATNLFRSILQVNPNDTFVLHMLGVMLPYGNNRCNEALQYLLQLKKLQALSYEEEVMMATCYFSVGQSNKAKRTVQVLHSTYPDMASRIALKRLFKLYDDKH